jgi:hypothetical protein
MKARTAFVLDKKNAPLAGEVGTLAFTPPWRRRRHPDVSRQWRGR